MLHLIHQISRSLRQGNFNYVVVICLSKDILFVKFLCFLDEFFELRAYKLFGFWLYENALPHFHFFFFDFFLTLSIHSLHFLMEFFPNLGFGHQNLFSKD